MFDLNAQALNTTTATTDSWHPYSEYSQNSDIECALQNLGVQRRLLHRKDYLFRSGQARHSLFFVRSGCFKTALLSEDGREKVTGFRMRGDLLGLDALGTTHYGCDVIALDVGEVFEIPCSALTAQTPAMQQWLTTAMSREIRRDWEWMMVMSTLCAEQRVATFLLDLAERQKALGYSSEQLVLHMTRGELGNFLALQLETVTRALSRLHAMNLIAVDRREIRIMNVHELRAIINAGTNFH
jgi:CRP/FNR family transcriptional regulator, anaerobic regulatory protein